MSAPTTTPTIIEALATMAAGPVPSDVIRAVPSRVIDIVGIAARATTLDTSAAVVGFSIDQQTAPRATAIGAEPAMSAAEAAFVNGVLAHSLDYDDTHLPSILHPSASVVPAALATAEHAGADGATTAAAIAVGLEVAVRLGMGGYDTEGRQSIYFERGQHATSICGAIGSAAAAARILSGESEAFIGHAMGIAASMASGIIEANRAGGTVKRLHCGWAARSGVTAAQLAIAGLTGPPTAIEGRFGLYSAFLGDEGNVDATVDRIGEHWESQRIFIKPYPANHFTHTAIDAAIALREAGVRPDDIASATLMVAAPTVRTIGDPLPTKQRPETGYQAQFSGPYAVAAGLIGGGGLGLGLADFTDALAVDPQHRALMAKINVVGDRTLDEIYPFQFPCRLQVTTTDGSQHQCDVLTNRGGPERPLSVDELARKFSDNVEELLPPAAIEQLTEGLASFTTVPSITSVLSPLGRITTRIESTA